MGYPTRQGRLFYVRSLNNSRDFRSTAYEAVPHERLPHPNLNTTHMKIELATLRVLKLKRAPFTKPLRNPLTNKSKSNSLYKFCTPPTPAARLQRT